MQTTGFAKLTKNVDLNTVTTVAPYLATLTSGVPARQMRRHGTALRVYRPEAVLSEAAKDAVVELVRTGAAVRVLEGTRVLTVRVAKDGEVVWTSRATNRDRANGGSARNEYFGLEAVTVVEVALA